MNSQKQEQQLLPCHLEHLAIIMDGNGRWAKSRGLSRGEGHRAGTLAAKKIIRQCLELGINHLTLYAFSKENWKRPAAEVTSIFDLLVEFISKELLSLHEGGVRLLILGELAKLPLLARKAISHAVEKTKNNRKMVLNIALNYSGREEILRAFKSFTEAGNSLDKLTLETLQDHLYTKGQPDPDLVIRTSGEMRTSNFLLFQTAYSEYYFTDTLWPDFDEKSLHEALNCYCTRTRRFGDTGEG